VTVLVTNPGDQPALETLNGVKIVRLPRLATLSSTPLSPGFLFYLRREKPQITHLHFPYPIAEISQMIAGRGRPYVISYHSDVVRPGQQLFLRLYRPLLCRALRGARRIIVDSKRYLQVSPFLQALAGQCTVVPIGIDPQPFIAASQSRKWNEQLKIFFLGRHRYYKGVDVLLKAMAHVDACLWIGGDGEMRQQWMQQANDLGLAERVKFIGDIPREDLPGVYASADLFVLPSTLRAEGFGIVLLEAMATGLPCITTELGTGTSFIVQDGVTGLVVPPNRPEALAEAIQRLLSDPELRARMGANGQERVLREFTVERMARQVERVYREALQTKANEI
jgi:rhamnosyl/mannosyltransferase